MKSDRWLLTVDFCQEEYRGKQASASCIKNQYFADISGEKGIFAHKKLPFPAIWLFLRRKHPPKNANFASDMEEQRIIFSTNLCQELSEAIKRTGCDRIYVLTDETTNSLCLPLLRDVKELASSVVITIPSGDENKNLHSLVHVWRALSEGRATRRSLLVNVGGGMVTDLGGFAASTFKRGILFINVPTTLLSMVDASAGGKTGINFCELKNEIGVFKNAFEVLVHTDFLHTLDMENLCSGFAEMLKHALISSAGDWAKLMQYDLQHPDWTLLTEYVKKSIGVKQRIVQADPEEHGLRKALNFGHTAGHAMESMSLLRHHPVLHGYAVAWGLVCELYLSSKRLHFPHEAMLQTIRFIKENYGVFAFNCKDYEQLYQLMTHDKKNIAGVINFTLLSDMGDIQINQTATKEEIFDMFDFYRETMGC